MQPKLRYMLAIPLLAIGLLSASSFAQAQTQPSLGLAGAGWRLIEIQRSPGDVEDTSNVTITLNFNDQGMASGQSTCNGYSSPYVQGPNGELTFSNILSTLRACVDTSLNDLESEYYAAVRDVTSYQLDNATLKLLYNNGNSVLTFEPTPVPSGGTNTGTGGGTVVGMPQTGVGSGFADVAPFAILGVSLVLLGAGFLTWKRSTDAS